MRLGQKNGVVRQWARTGTRPRQAKDQRYKSVYLFGAICPARGKGAALVMPFANTDAMQAHLEEISRAVAPKSHAVMLMDRAGWHTTGQLDMPENITVVLLPSSAPELNPVETSGSTFVRHTSPIACLLITTRSLMPLAKLGTGLSENHGKLCPSECAIGLTQVNINDGWYKFAILFSVIFDTPFLKFEICG